MLLTLQPDLEKKHKEFEIDNEIQDKLLITTCPDGFLRKLK